MAVSNRPNADVDLAEGAGERPEKASVRLRLLPTLLVVAADLCRGLVELAERYADKRYTGERIPKSQIDDSLNTAQKAARGLSAGQKCAFVAADCLLRYQMEGGAAVWAARAVIDDARGDNAETARIAERAVQAALLRDVLGNPFRPVTVDPSWPARRAVGPSGRRMKGYGRLIWLELGQVVNADDSVGGRAPTPTWRAGQALWERGG